jgi:hypothetical protein
MISVKQLKQLCEEQIARGNGNKKVLLSSDDEWNNFHPLHWGFEENLDSWDIYLDNVKDFIILG